MLTEVAQILIVLLGTYCSVGAPMLVPANDGIDNFLVNTERLPKRAKYDFIIVGSGPGGSPIANRLSEIPQWRILLLEAGKPEGIANQIPRNSFIGTEYDWQYLSEPQDKACLSLIDRRCPYTKGKALGGSTTINSMVYSRGHRFDFDSWAMHGNYGWSYKEVLPYFIKTERAKLRERSDKPYRGRSGYLHVQNAARHTLLAEAYLQSGKELGYDVIDYNGRHHIGFSYDQFTMANGTRCSASRAYLRVKRSNLDIVAEARVSRVLIDSRNRAYGIEFSKNNVTYRIYARKEVILAAGAINTPQLLMLSGIGPKRHLEKLGIKVRKDSPVGYRLSDHVSFPGLTFLVDHNGTEAFSIGGGEEALAFTRTRYARDSRPDVELIFGASSFNQDNNSGYQKSRRLTEEIYNAVWKPIVGRHVFTIWPALQLPRSKGRIKLRSTDVDDPPIIEPDLLSHDTDVEILVEGIKMAIQISKSEAFRRYNTRLHDGKIPGCAAFGFATDDYWRCAIRHVTVTFSHDMGTAKMGPSTDRDAVVDPELRVHGIKKLRVVDASIIPDVLVGHLSATIYMIAERGADMIKQTWANDH